MTRHSTHQYLHLSRTLFEHLMFTEQHVPHLAAALASNPSTPPGTELLAHDPDNDRLYLHPQVQALWCGWTLALTMLPVLSVEIGLPPSLQEHPEADS